MKRIVPVDPTRCRFDIGRDLSVTPRERKPGPPERIDGHTVGFLTLTEDAPHNGEMHPDGDEILFVISGRVRVTGESDPDSPLELGPGDACIVPQGEWHKVHLLENPTRFVHVTPGPHGDHRPL